MLTDPHMDNRHDPEKIGKPQSILHFKSPVRDTMGSTVGTRSFVEARMNS
jgi:hypothetical protein